MAWNPLEYFRDHHLPLSYAPLYLDNILFHDYALCGAYAMKSFLPQRATYALDLLITPASKKRTIQALDKLSSRKETFSNTHTFYRLREETLYLNLLSIDAPWVTTALTDSRKNIDPTSLEPVLTFPWLILSKLNYGKRQDYMDCARLISRATPKQLEETKRLLNKWLPTALPDLRKLYRIGKQELKHAPKNKPAYLNQETSYTPWHHMSAAQMDYLNVNWKELVDQPEQDLLTTPLDWPESHPLAEA